jgi:hypothetical protein
VDSAPPRPLRRTCLRMLGRRFIDPGGGRIPPGQRRVKSCGVVVRLGCSGSMVSSFLVFGVVSKGPRFQTNQLRANVSNAAVQRKAVAALLLHPPEVEAC